MGTIGGFSERFSGLFSRLFVAGCISHGFLAPFRIVSYQLRPIVQQHADGHKWIELFGSQGRVPLVEILVQPLSFPISLGLAPNTQKTSFFRLGT